MSWGVPIHGNSQSFGSNEFWDGVPDDAMSDIYKQLNTDDQEPDEFDPLQHPENPPVGEMLLNDHLNVSQRHGLNSSLGFGISNSGLFAQGGSQNTSLSFGFNGNQSQPQAEQAIVRKEDPLHEQPTPMEVQTLPKPGEFIVQLPPRSNQETTQYLKAKGLIEHIAGLKVSQAEQLEDMLNVQAYLLKERKVDRMARLARQQQRLKTTIIHELERLYECVRVIIFEAGNLFIVRQLISQLNTQKDRLFLYSTELASAMSGKPTHLLASLIIKQQPLPQVLFKKKQIEDVYCVQLITSAAAPIQEFSVVVANITARPDDKAKGKLPSLANGLTDNKQAMDRIVHKAIFQTMKVTVSTRMHMVYAKFSMQIKSEDVAQQIESPHSFPFIVITNESQWCDAARKLVLEDAFAGNHQAQIPFAQFANVFHSHFLTATRQSASDPARPLQHYEFKYLHKKFFNNDQQITRAQASTMWAWIGPVLQSIRFKRHISSLWTKGYIFGFFTKEACNKALARQPVGTFMIRFSESKPGLFGVAYVSTDAKDPVKHYLVKAEDIGSNKSLPDFIHEKQQFKDLVVMKPGSNSMYSCPKDELLNEMYSKRTKSGGSGPPTGYSALQ